MRRDPSLIPLSQQHHNGLALCVMSRRSMKSDTSAVNCERLAKRIVDRYELELANHFELEETLLFPAIRSEVGQHPLLDALEREHRQMERMVNELREKVPSPDELEQFCALLEQHIRREERNLFEDVQDRLSVETRTVLLHELESRAVRICL